ncbi:hypothetical protein I79_017095 [Cricetulus griseus]|uniref:Uncharacterized protein n=1 Tax=Cricetulus griseus TaxID=10029 RepID=G3I149_CRIGR|nr:hypothetical protein I79_017095 [Cricetulus griseus]
MTLGGLRKKPRGQGLYEHQLPLPGSWTWQKQASATHEYQPNTLILLVVCDQP